MYAAKVLALVALPLLATANPLPQSGGAIPLNKRSSVLHANGSVNVTRLRANIGRSMAKLQRGFAAYERNTGKPHSLSAGTKSAKRATGSDPLTDDESQLWFGTISVGTPPKDYTVDFDTGSSDLFLPSPSCTRNCQGHTLYDPKSSSSSRDLRKKFSLQYGDGSSVGGEQFTDTVAIAGLTATKQTLGAAVVYSDGFNSDQFPPDGLLGMGFKSISDYNANPLFQTLIAQHKTSSPVFGFKFAESGSELFLGGTNEALYKSEFTYVDVTEEGYWQVDLDGATMNGQTVSDSTSSIIDTGTTQIIADPDTVSAIYGQINGAKELDDGSGIYSVPCDLSSDLSLTFGGKSFPVSSKSMNIGPLGDGSGHVVEGSEVDFVSQSSG
ncbi:hypothetical protein EWM64_g1904 [Hericium alpestre]|uniref:Peptidase A1 domain-containing protein n=1 Tax=Hericium alpestre TaxID=135208 RepID=A0A4Z0A749_9AGAM|nr:hypothetical protein EWM64_g1904 [Hericium alpestre]